MSLKTLLILWIFIFLHGLGFTQRIKWENFNNRANWRANRLELQAGFCATQFTGDLGGGAGQGIDYSMKDMDNEAL
jgi:hypothetical protein